MGEKTKSIRIFVSIVLSLFILAIIYFTGSVARGFKNGASRAEKDFTRIAETASSAVFFDTNSSAVNELKNLLTDNEYAAAALVASEKNILFAYPAASPLIGMTAEGKPAIRSSSPMLRIFSTRLAAAPDDNTMLTVALYTVRPKDIYNPARLSFLVILTGLAAVITVLIYTSKTSKNEAFGKTAKTDCAAPSENTEDNAVFFTAAGGQSVKQSSGTAADKYVNTPLTEESQPETKTHVNSEDNAQTELYNYDDIEHSGETENQEDPSGLFSPATGVGWEEYLETRLDSELMRSASSEQDLALILLRVPGIENNRLMMKKMAAVLLDFFKFKDFVFEYKNDGFAGILLNINLDQTMVLAETVYTQFKELFESENIDLKFALGISMRSLRILTGSRLIDEADKAMQKAFEEKGMPIVAFRVNPDKYRQFIADSAETVMHR